MKKRIALLLAMLLLTGCGAPAPDCVEPVVAFDMEGADAAAGFGVALFQESLEEGRNTLISPLSVLTALAMAANGAEGETLEQMEAVLGTEHIALNEFMADYTAHLQGEELHMANAIWFRDDPALTVAEDFLEVNEAVYDAARFRAPFDADTVRDINGWVSAHTDGMIDQLLTELPPEAMLFLVNALAFDAEWEKPYEKQDVRRDIFYFEDGRPSDLFLEMMHGKEELYLEDERATGFIKPYAGGRFAFAALLPKAGVSVAEYVEHLTGDHLRQLLSAPEEILVLTTMPKFKAEHSAELRTVLERMGMTDAFEAEAANFSRMGTAPGGLYLDRVIHRTYLEVSEQGTKAAAATGVMVLSKGAETLPEHRVVRLDRPFVYVLFDTATNLPIFLGTMMDPYI